MPIWLSDTGGVFSGEGVGVGRGVEDMEDVTTELVAAIVVVGMDSKVDISVAVGEGVTSNMQANLPSSLIMHISPSLHGLEEQGLTFISHSRPVKPSGQMQTNSPNKPLTQVALLKHGSAAHSSISIEQFLPV